VSINATVSFTVSQALMVAEAVEKGLLRRENEGKDTSQMGPVCTLMVGRLDDWLRIVAEKDGIIANPRIFDWAGVAVMKKTYKVYQEKGFRLRLLSAAMRNHLHWSEFIGGDVVISPPYEWQCRFNASDVPVINRMDIPVEAGILDELLGKFGEFRRAYADDGLVAADFDQYGATRRTLRQFCKAVDDLAVLIRDILIPNPDS
jgi:transaldolase